MESVFRVCLFITGIINILPSIIAFLPQKVESAYGVALPDANYELLIRHRAVLFGIIGGIMIWSALSKKSYDLSFIIGMISMTSFILIYKVVAQPVQVELLKVVKIDIIGIFILLIGYLLYKFY